MTTPALSKPQPYWTSCLLALALFTPQTWACGSFIPLPRIIYPPQVLIPAVADRMDLWQDEIHLTTDDLLYILLPEKASLSFKDNTQLLHRLSTKEAALAGKMPPPIQQAGYEWWQWVATTPGLDTLQIEAGAQKKSIKIEVQAYQPRYEIAPRQAHSLKPENATQEKPFPVSIGESIEIILPGDIASGWTVNDSKDSGLTLSKIEALPSYSNTLPNQVKLTFEARLTSNRDQARHLQIKSNSGFFNFRSFDFYLEIRPAVMC